MADVQSSEFIHKRIMNPGLDKISHVNKLGIQLKSSWMPRKSRLQSQMPPKSSYQTRRKMSPNLLSSAQPQRPATVAQMSGNSTEFIQNMVIPISSNVQNDEINVQRSMSPKSFYSTTRFKQVPLPIVSPRDPARTPASHRPVSICSERYLSSINPESRLASDSEHSQWNESEQATRMEAGKKALDRCRMLKRTSEVKSYRVDRLYYMSASPCQLHHRYLIDANELKMLQDRQRVQTPRIPGEYRPTVEERSQHQTSSGHYPPIRRGVKGRSQGHTFMTEPDDNTEHTTREQNNRPRTRSAASSRSSILHHEKDNTGTANKKRIGSSKSVTFSEPTTELKVVGQATAGDSGKESGIESGAEEGVLVGSGDRSDVENGADHAESENGGKIDNAENGGEIDSDETGGEIDSTENGGERDNADNVDVDHIESGVDADDIDDSGADNNEIDNDEYGSSDAINYAASGDDVENEVDQVVDSSVGDNYVDDVNDNDLKDDDGEVDDNDGFENGEIDNVDDSGDAFNLNEDSEGEQTTEFIEQTTSAQIEENGGVDDDSGNAMDNANVEPQQDEDEKGVTDNDDEGNGDNDEHSHQGGEAHEGGNLGSSVAMDQVVLVDDDANEEKAEDDGAKRGSIILAADDVDALLKLI